MPNLTAPGEDAGDGAMDGPTQLAAMVRALRDAEGLRPLARDAALDALAFAHARRMMGARAVAHDVGDGEPADRVQSAGIPAREAGENVAHAATIQLGHRALWQSPSHRANLMRSDFARAGFGVVADADGSAWICELFVK